MISLQHFIRFVMRWINKPVWRQFTSRYKLVQSGFTPFNLDIKPLKGIYLFFKRKHKNNHTVKHCKLKCNQSKIELHFE